MPTQKQIQHMLELMHVRDLRKLSKYYGFTITKQIGGYKSKNDLVYDLIGGKWLSKVPKGKRINSVFLGNLKNVLQLYITTHSGEKKSNIVWMFSLEESGTNAAASDANGLYMKGTNGIYEDKVYKVTNYEEEGKAIKVQATQFGNPFYFKFNFHYKSDREHLIGELTKKTHAGMSYVKYGLSYGLM